MDQPDIQEEAHLWEYLHVILRRRRLVAAVFLVVATAATVRTALTRPVYRAEAQILIERENPNVLTFKEVASVDSERDDYYQTQYKLLQSRALARKVIEEMGLLQDPEFGGPRSAADRDALRASSPGTFAVMEGCIDEFLSRLHVQPVRSSRLVAVQFEAFRPDLAAQAANKLSQLYIQQTMEFRYQTSADAGQWLGGQTAEQRSKVEQAEVALQKLKEKEGIVNIEERRTLIDQRLREVGSALTSLKTQRLEKEALYRQMKEAVNPEELPEVMRNPLIQALRIELANLDRQSVQLQERYLDQHPEVVKNRNQIAETRKRIAAEAQRVIRSAENDYRAAMAQEQSVAVALETAKGEALGLSRRGVQYDSLKRELDANKDVLNSLLTRHKQTDVAQELKASNIRVVDPAAIPQGPVRPNHRSDILTGIFLGLTLGVVLAFFLEYLDNTIKTPEEVRLHLGVPLLGVIPERKLDAEGTVLTAAHPQGPFVEGYRVLRTALSYSWAGQGSRVLVVASTAPAEGKTLTAVNLALTLAAMDGSILLIDGDLRKPQAHERLGAKKSPGLSDILVGKAKLGECVQRLTGTDLSLLPSGSHAPSPGELMAPHLLRVLVDSLRGTYSWIVIDTPPVGAVADALILSSISDGVLVVAQAERIPRQAVRRTLQRVREAGARILGLVLNRVQIEGNAYYYSYYYGHYYGDYHQESKPPKVALINKQAAR
jgi:capsular exopolysaccharide synthesis family protein